MEKLKRKRAARENGEVDIDVENDIDEEDDLPDTADLALGSEDAELGPAVIGGVGTALLPRTQTEKHKFRANNAAGLCENGNRGQRSETSDLSPESSSSLMPPILRPRIFSPSIIPKIWSAG